MSETQFACLSLTIISIIANHLCGVDDYWYGVVKAAILTSYMFQILIEIIHLLESRHLQAIAWEFEDEQGEILI